MTFRTAILSLYLGCLAADSRGQPSVGGPVEPAKTVVAETIFLPGDRFRFFVVEDAESSAEVVVNGGGAVILPLLGFWTVAGKTFDQVAAETERALEAEFLVKATVRLILVDRPVHSGNRGRVFLTGQLRKIGAVDIDLSVKNTLGRVILANGGLGDFADAKRIRIIRKAPNGIDLQTQSVDLEEVLVKGRIDKDIPLVDGDFIIVDSKLINW